MDIVTLPIEHDRNKIDSRFRLIVMASQRAKELTLGVKPKIHHKGHKPTTIAVEETLDNVLEYLTGDEAVQAREEAKKFDYRRLLEERRRETLSEDMSELEKDLKVYLNEREGAQAVQNIEDIFREEADEEEDEGAGEPEE